MAGVSAAAAGTGVREKGRLDLALFFSDAPCRVAAFYTTNRLNGGHIPLCRDNLAKSKGLAQALLVNSGVANCSVGPRGKRDSAKLARETARLLGIPAERALAASTGLIGVPLPVDRMAKKLPALAKKLKKSDSAAAARAIMTTDTVPKMVAVEVSSPGGKYRIAGVAKGSGMIAPNLATQFGFVFTDADVALPALRGISRRCVDGSFNRIAVDGDTSPNDTVFVFANGASGVKVPQRGAGAKLFEDALHHVCRRLAVELVRDGEGATKLIEITVDGAATAADARRAARAVGLSPLVKTAVFGEDPNWGRIITALGYSGAAFDPDRARIEVDGTVVFDKGKSRGLPSGLMKGKEVGIKANLRAGKASAKFWTCDFSHDYVKINAEYTT